MIFTKEDFSKLKWRHHGTGMMQSYLPDGRRVHAWHPDLIYPEVVSSGGHIHNHRFDLTSRVVAGKIGNTPYNFGLSLQGAWILYECVHYSKQVVEKGDSLLPWACAREIGERYTYIYDAGSQYFIPKGVFHCSHVVDFALSLVKRDSIDESMKAIVAGLKGLGPRYAFSEDGGKTHSNREELLYNDLPYFVEVKAVELAEEPLLDFLADEHRKKSSRDAGGAGVAGGTGGEGEPVVLTAVGGGGGHG